MKQPEEDKKLKFNKLSYRADITDLCYPGIFRYVIDIPEKQGVFFGEAEENTWLEMYDFLDVLVEKKEDYPDLVEDLDKYGDNFRLEVVEVNPQFQDSDLRRAALEKNQNDFITFHPTFHLYKKVEKEGDISFTELASSPTEAEPSKSRPKLVTRFFNLFKKKKGN